MPDRPTITALAPAKLNLVLAVAPPDGTGLHPICSWMVTVDLFDELQVTRLEDDRLSRYAILWHPEARRPTDIGWSITSDLAVRAHLVLEEHAGRRLPVQLKLQKRIPVGTGLGGGSSDAAAMLRAVNRLFGLGLGTTELAALGARVGADVPFLVHGGSAVVQGIGAEVTPHEGVPELHAVVCFPDATCATGEVYARFDAMPSGSFRPDAVLELAAARATPPRPDALFNDLTRPAIRSAPVIESVMADLGALAERPAALSGSGAAVFVVCDDALHADALAAAAEQQMDLPAVAVRTVPREALAPSSMQEAQH